MTSTQQSILYTVLFHMLIVGIMFLIHFDPPEPPPILDYIEFITFENLVPPPQRQLLVNSDGEQNAGNQAMVPNAQQLDIPESTIPDYVPFDWANLPDKADHTQTGNLYQTSYQDSLLASQNVYATSDNPANTGQSTNSSLNLGGMGDAIKAEIGSTTNYDLQGDVRNRTIISRVLPSFPAGVTRNGSVTLQFTVLPNGSVTDVNITTMSSEPEFNNVSVSSLREWRFNQSDRSHTGQITFNFRLE